MGQPVKNGTWYKKCTSSVCYREKINGFYPLRGALRLFDGCVCCLSLSITQLPSWSLCLEEMWEAQCSSEKASKFFRGRVSVGAAAKLKGCFAPTKFLKHTFKNILILKICSPKFLIVDFLHPHLWISYSPMFQRNEIVSIMLSMLYKTRGKKPFIQGGFPWN